MEAAIAKSQTRGRKVSGHVHARTAVAVLACLLFVAGVAGLAWGTAPVPLHSMLEGHLSADQRIILFEIRLPRVIASAMVGAALSVSGLLFQGLFRNPLADPYVIGSSGGAVLGASAGMIFLPQLTWMGFSAIAVLAFLGSMATVMVVYGLARVHGQTRVLTLLLAGFAVSTMMSNSSFLVEVLDQQYGMGLRVLAMWLHGAIGVPRWPQLGVIAVLLAVAFPAAAMLARRLNTLALGDEYAQQLGVRVELVRLGIIVVGSLFAAAAVALSGLIGFVGLIIPHVARLIVGPDHLRLLPVTALAGALFLLVTDTLARTVIAPSELPVGVLMAFVGGPFFLYLLRQSKGGESA